MLATLAAWAFHSGNSMQGGTGGSGLIEVLVYLVVISLIFWAILWFVGWVGVPEPFNKVIKVVLGLFALLIVINVLLGLIGHPLVSW